MTTEKTEVSRDEWLQQRRLGIGGSDAAATCGLSPWKSPIELWIEKTGIIQLDDETGLNEAMYWGNTLEAVVCDEFQKRTGLIVKKQNGVITHVKYPWMRANLDRVIVENGEEGVLEAKTACMFSLKDWESGNISAQYLLQMMHYLAVTGYSFGYFACLVGGQRFFYHRVERDDKMIENLIWIEADFWASVVNNIPPAIDGSESCSEYLKKLFPESNGETIQLDPKFEQTILNIETVKRQISDMKAIETLNKNLLINEMGNAEIGIVNGRTITYKTSTRSSIETNALKADEPALCEKYTRNTQIRTLLIKGETK